MRTTKDDNNQIYYMGYIYYSAISRCQKSFQWPHRLERPYKSAIFRQNLYRSCVFATCLLRWFVLDRPNSFCYSQIWISYTTSKLGEAWMCTNKALWPLRIGFLPEKGSKIEPKSDSNVSEMAQKRVQKRLRKAQDNIYRCI